MSKKALGPRPEGFFLTSRSVPVVFVALLLLLPALGSTPLHRAEIYFADAARAMVERGDWVVPYFRGEPFFDKPALMYWIMAVPMRLFGPSVATARVGSAIAAVLVVLLTVWLGRAVWRDQFAGLAAGWILLTTVPFMAFGRIAMSDMPLTLFTLIAFCSALAFFQRALPANRAILICGAALGLAFLTKGPIAVLMPGLGFPYMLWTFRKNRPSFNPVTIATAAAIFFILAFGWFAVIYLRMGMAPLDHFFIRENLQRFSGAAYDIGRPAWFYLVTYLGQGAPWSLFLPLAALHFFRKESDVPARILLAWLLLGGILLTASRGKLDYYLVPLYPPAALVIGRYLQTSGWGRADRFLASVLLGIAGLVSLALPIGLFRLPAEWRPQGLEMLGIVVVLVGAGVVAVGMTTRRPTPFSTLATLAGILSVVTFIVNTSILPAYYANQPNRVLLQSVDAERRNHQELTVAAYGDPLQFHRELLFDSRMILQESDNLEALAQSGKPYLFLVNDEESRALRLLPGIREVTSQPYLPSRALTFRGVFAGVSPERMTLLANFGS